jgi:predicted hotdog family 3-hydroxylacyl-ACP dehydratase
MCLIDTVIAWDADQIRCSSSSHRLIDNPLRAHGRLGIACGIEYASQAMAVHGALTRGAGADQPVNGLLAGIRAVEFHALRLDDVSGELLCEAVRLAGDHLTALYEFELHSAAGRLLVGRATVILDPRHKSA